MADIIARHNNKVNEAHMIQYTYPVVNDEKYQVT